MSFYTFLFLFVLIAGWLLYKKLKPHSQTKAKLTVDLYGDSVLYGYSVDKTPIELMRELRPKWKVVDHTACGLDTKELLEGYDKSDPNLSAEYMRNGPQPPFKNIDRFDVDVVVIQTGFNDAFHQVGNYKYNLKQVVQTALDEGKIVVIAGIFNVEIKVPLLAPYNDITHQVAKELSVTHACWGENYQGLTDVSPDTIHRRQWSSNRLTQALVETIEKACVEQRLRL